jgi:tRNA-splicing ligase RtcB
VCTEFQKLMAAEAPKHGLVLPERDLAAAPLTSATGRAYLGAMRAAINCALANRQILGHLVRGVFSELFPGAGLPLLYDVSHNTCKEETHVVGGKKRRLHVHRKGATRALGPGHRELPAAYRPVGQPVLIGGSMGTGSWILVGTAEAEARSFASALHGAGRTLSRRDATRRWNGEEVVRGLATRGILVRTVSWRGVAEEAPGAYKDVDAVVEATAAAGLATPVARLRPLIVVKG